jgi:peptidoglycan biosynthesis protein MviN/MurJ (putative lipid II flippase)
MQNTRSPQLAAIITVACNIIFNLILIQHMQAAGLALATSIAFFVRFTVLFIQFRRKFGAFGGAALIKNIIKYIISSAGMIPVFFLFELLRNRLPLFIFFAGAATVSLCVYATLLYLFRAELFIEALKRVKTYIIARLKKKNNI